MRINFVLPSIGHSGGMDVVYRYAELLAKAGHDVLIYKEIKSSNMHRYKNDMINLAHQVYCTAKGVIKASKKNISYDKFVFELNDKTVRNANVIIATAWTTAYKVSKLSEEKGRKYYFIQDYEVWDNSEFVNRSYKLPLNKIVISTWINKQLYDNLGIGPFPIVYNGIDTGIFHRSYVKKDKTEITFLMLNHTLPKKGVEFGLKVYETISKKIGRCRLQMFGMCDHSNLPAYVEYYQNPSKEKLVELYSTSDIFIFPSFEEGWGLTPLEAMACGCVVVGTRTGFVLDFGIHKENMMISQPGDLKNMVCNIEEVLIDSKMQEAIRRGGLELTSKLRWEKSTGILESLLYDYFRR